MAGGDEPRGRGRGQAGRGRGRGGGAGRGRNNTGGRGRGRGGSRGGEYQNSNHRQAAPKPAPKAERFDDDDESWEQVNKHRAARVAPSQTTCVQRWLSAHSLLSHTLQLPAAAAAGTRWQPARAAARLLATER